MQQKTSKITTLRKKKVVILSAASFIVLASLLSSSLFKQMQSRKLITLKSPYSDASITMRQSDYNRMTQEEKDRIFTPNPESPDSCKGNSEDNCKSSASIDFYPTGSEDATNPEFINQTGNYKETMGRITAIDGKTVQIKTSSARIFNIQFPIDAVTNFNTVRSPYYDNIHVTTGDMLDVLYDEAVAAKDTTITSTQLFRSSLLIKEANIKKNPDAPIEKY